MASFCKECGVGKTAENARKGAQLCSSCEKARFLRNRACDISCGSSDVDHRYWECPKCRDATRKRRSEAGMRGAATRRKSSPHMARPFNAEQFWQSKAHSMVSAAIRRGILPKLDGTIACIDCGKAACVYEHRDYGRPLDVHPVCTSCNLKRGTAIWPCAERYQFARIAQAIAA